MLAQYFFRIHFCIEFFIGKNDSPDPGHVEILEEIGERSQLDLFKSQKKLWEDFAPYEECKSKTH